MHYVFVYGTLKRHYSNHSLLAGAEFIGRYKSTTEYLMFLSGPTGGIPFVVEPEQAPDAFLKYKTAIHGEVYYVNDYELGNLDALEGHPRWYRREERIFFSPSEDSYVKAWVYLMPFDELGYLRSFRAGSREYDRAYHVVPNGLYTPGEFTAERVVSVGIMNDTAAG